MMEKNEELLDRAINALKALLPKRDGNAVTTTNAYQHGWEEEARAIINEYLATK